MRQPMENCKKRLEWEVRLVTLERLDFSGHAIRIEDGFLCMYDFGPQGSGYSPAEMIPISSVMRVSLIREK